MRKGYALPEFVTENWGYAPYLGHSPDELDTMAGGGIATTAHQAAKPYTD